MGQVRAVVVLAAAPVAEQAEALLAAAVVAVAAGGWARAAQLVPCSVALLVCSHHTRMGSHHALAVADLALQLH